MTESNLFNFEAAVIENMDVIDNIETEEPGEVLELESHAAIENCVEVDNRNVEEIIPRIFENSLLVELSKSSWYPSVKSHDMQTYLRGCKWSPDGTCCLAVVNNGGVHVLELPRDLYQGDEVSSDRPIDLLDSVIKVPECGLIYDFCWYPGMNSMAPESCCWLTTRQNAPIQMWDAFDGALRCSYRGFNSVDEVEAAISVCFSANGEQIHGGYRKCLKTFDTNRPGREYVNQKLNSSASSLAVSPVSNTVIAVGSWKTEISLYDINQGITKSIGKMKYHSGGVTHLQFMADGSKLISGARKDSSLLVWDIRFYKRPLKILQREVNTNQRIYFDVSKCGRYLVSGGTGGIVSVWDILQEISTEDMDSTYSQSLYPLHNDCCNGVSLHPCRPILATSSGQHHIHHSEDTLNTNDHVFHENNVRKEDNKENNMNMDELNTANGNNGTTDEIGRIKIENSVQFWWIGNTILNNKITT